MRNISEYPVTQEEVLQALQDAYHDFGHAIGDLRPMIFSDLAERLSDKETYKHVMGSLKYYE